MIPTTTGIAFSLSSIGLAFCGLWFFKAFQKIGGLRSGSRIGVLLSAWFLAEAFQHSILAIGGLFFSHNPEALYGILVIDHFLLAFITALGIYLVFYILLPNYSPWPATILTSIFGLLVSFFMITAHSLPFVNSTNGIDWNIPRWLAIPWYSLLVLNIGAIFIIFLKNFFIAKSRDVKIASVVIVVIHFSGLVNITLIFLRSMNQIDSDLQTNIFDKVLSGIGLLFIAAFLIVPIAGELISKSWRSESR